MMDSLMPPLVVGIITFGIYKLFELFVRKRERLALIEKLGSIPTDIVGSIKLPDFSRKSSFSALKGGLLLIGVGLGLLIGFFICANSFPDYFGMIPRREYGDTIGLIYSASVLICGGAGLVAAFLIEVKMTKKKEE